MGSAKGGGLEHRVWSLEANEPPVDRGTEYRFGEV